VGCLRLETVIAAPMRAIGGVSSGAMEPGDTVTWRARHFGVAFRMTAVITEYQYPGRFVDEQLHGPFQRWWHEHTFKTAANGETLMTDVVQFQSPLGPLGSLADHLVLDRYLPHLLRQRNTWLKATLEART
jgi:ligand-binding SRPBCC domain-containing protein